MHYEVIITDDISEENLYRNELSFVFDNIDETVDFTAIILEESNYKVLIIPKKAN